MWEPKTEIERIMFRKLEDIEEAKFREYARTHLPPSDVEDIGLIYHPVCISEWNKLGLLSKPYKKEQ